MNKDTVDCSICLTQLNESNINVSIGTCLHKFHTECIQQWNKNTCPICRTETSFTILNSSFIDNTKPKHIINIDSRESLIDIDNNSSIFIKDVDNNNNSNKDLNLFCHICRELLQNFMLIGNDRYTIDVLLCMCCTECQIKYYSRKYTSDIYPFKSKRKCYCLDRDGCYTCKTCSDFVDIKLTSSNKRYYPCLKKPKTIKSFDKKKERERINKIKLEERKTGQSKKPKKKNVKKESDIRYLSI